MRHNTGKAVTVKHISPCLVVFTDSVASVEYMMWTVLPFPTADNCDLLHGANRKEFVTTMDCLLWSC